MLLGFENPKFCETLYRHYHPSKFQISWLSGSIFMEVSVRHEILSLFLVIMSLWHHLLMLRFKVAYFIQHSISYQPCKFQLSRMSGSNFTGGGVFLPPPPQCCTKRKKPSAFRVNGHHVFESMSLLGALIFLLNQHTSRSNHKQVSLFYGATYFCLST